MTARNQLAHATYNLIASQRPRRDARLLHDGGHGAGVDTVTPSVVESINARLPRPQVAGSRTSLAILGPEYGENQNVAVERPPTGSMPRVGVLRSDTWEDARQRNASQRGYEYVAPKGVEVLDTLQPDTEGTIACDVELCRVALGLRQAAQMRLWLVLVQYARESGYNHITRTDFMALLDKYEITYNVPNFHRWLRQGAGVYWNLDSDRVWLIGYKRLSIALVDKVLAMPKPKRGIHPINLVLTNNPGYFRHIYIKVASKNLTEFEAACYSGWLTAKDDPTISRYSLSHLFRRHPNILRRWERIAKVKKLNTFTHYTEETSNFIPQAPEGGHRGEVIEYTVKGRKRWSAEFSNTYQTQPTRQHDKRGQCLTVSRILHKKLESLRSAGPTAQIPYRDGRLHRGGRKIFQDAKSAKSYANPKNPQEQYIIRGVDNRQCLHLECSPDGVGRTRLVECSDASGVLEMQ